MLMAKPRFTARNIILTIIILAAIAVACVVFSIFFFSPENVVKRTIPAIATDYYENYFYPEITEGNINSPSDIFSKYTNTGFSRITFRQLLFYDAERHPDAAAAITTYCDLSGSYIQIYPESPFGKSDYRIDYHYSCQFK